MTSRWRRKKSPAFAALACWITLLASYGAVAASPIVVLGEQDKPAHQLFVDGFKQYLTGKDGTQAFVDIGTGEGAPGTARLKETVQRENPPLVLTIGEDNLSAATAASLDRPLLASFIRDAAVLENNPVATGVVLEYKVETQLAWIKRLFPELKTIGVLYNPTESGARVEVAMKTAARLGLKFVAQAVDSPNELPVAMESLFRRVDVLWGITDPVVLSRQTAKAILLTSFRNKVPFIAPSSAWVKAGALYALDFDYGDIGAQTGEIAQGVLNGRKVASIDPQEPRKVRYSLNLRTAEHMRLELPGKVVDGAVQVFE